MKDKHVVHAPVKKGECETCHEQADAKVHKFKYAETTAALCYLCHDSLTEKKKFVHQPLQEEGNSCVLCHDPHSSDAAALLKAKTTLELCVRCHSDMSAGDALHQSEDQTCTDCHDPHASGESKLLRAKVPDLCFKCHSDVRDDIKQNTVVHGPVAAGCTVCHDPHRTLSGKGLKKEGEQLCMTCHEDFKDKLSALSQRHPQLLSHDGCRRCHAPHAAKNKFLLRDEPVNLCLACHDKDITARDGRVIAGLAQVRTKGATLHGPLSTGQCAPCHEPHGNLEEAFLSRAYPAAFYSPYSDEAYALCFGCHDRRLAQEAATADATGFRDGKRNLHYLHVNKAGKGRVCRACHVPHAGGNSHLLADSVPFGNWQLPIGFKQTETGGTCAPGCHSAASYSRPETKPSDEPNG
jgi:predicted CXXCH cytochrome family protein